METIYYITISNTQCPRGVVRGVPWLTTWHHVLIKKLASSNGLTDMNLTWHDNLAPCIFHQNNLHNRMCWPTTDCSFLTATIRCFLINILAPYISHQQDLHHLWSTCEWQKSWVEVLETIDFQHTTANGFSLNVFPQFHSLIFITTVFMLCNYRITFLSSGGGVRPYSRIDPIR